MAQTLRQVCSDILHGLKAYNLDDYVSFRYIKNILLDKASYFTKQDAEMRKLTKLGDVWKPIDCVEMCPTDITDCGVTGCSSLVKSRIKIPAAYQTGYGYALKVFNTNYTKEYVMIQPSYYKDLAARRFKPSNGYFWLLDNHIYIPDSEVEVVTVLGMFKEDARLVGEDCPKVLDSSFPFPDYIVTISKQETLKELLTTTRNIKDDQNPNLNNRL